MNFLALALVCGASASFCTGVGVKLADAQSAHIVSAWGKFIAVDEDAGRYRVRKLLPLPKPRVRLDLPSAKVPMRVRRIVGVAERRTVRPFVINNYFECAGQIRTHGLHRVADDVAGRRVR